MFNQNFDLSAPKRKCTYVWPLFPGQSFIAMISGVKRRPQRARGRKSPCFFSISCWAKTRGGYVLSPQEVPAHTRTNTRALKFTCSVGSQPRELFSDAWRPNWMDHGWLKLPVQTPILQKLIPSNPWNLPCWQMHSTSGGQSRVEVALDAAAMETRDSQWQAMHSI